MIHFLKFIMHLVVAPRGRVVQRKICCPFHEERTPSCYVFVDDTFFCFGCCRMGHASELPQGVQS